MTRPAISMEIRRKVLIEAGHRCAIPHCSHTDVDLHHIIPWEQCKAHSPENLIALCPNCHRLAEQGKIDRKSLIQYKLRGQRILAGNAANHGEALDPWTTTVWEDRQKSDLHYYEAQIEYPHFDSSIYSWSTEIDAYVRELCFSQVQGIRNIANEAPWTWGPLTTDEGESSFGSSYEIVFFELPLLSMRFSFFAYSFGAAHPNHWTRSLNFFLDPVYSIELRHFFCSNAQYMSQISIAPSAFRKG